MAAPFCRMAVALTLLAAGACAALADTPAPPKSGLPAKPGSSANSPRGPALEDDTKRVRMERRPVAIQKDPILIEAAKTRPVAPEVLGRAIPAKIAGYTRGTVTTKINQVGPAMTAEASTVMSGQKGREIRVLITDSAGMPEGMTGRPDPLKVGEKRGSGVSTREGIDLGGYPAVIERAGDVSRVNVWITPRIHLALDGERVGRDDLVAAAKGIDLKALAAAVK